jgi:hypothetical protein
MFEDSKADQIITGLTKLTVKNELKWDINLPAECIASGTSSKFPFYAEAVYKHRVLAFALERYKNYAEVDEYEWSEVFRLFLLDSRRKLQYTFPQSSAMRDLHQAIQEQTADIDDLFEDLIDDIPF